VDDEGLLNGGEEVDGSDSPTVDEKASSTDEDEDNRHTPKRVESESPRRGRSPARRDATKKKTRTRESAASPARKPETQPPPAPRRWFHDALTEGEVILYWVSMFVIGCAMIWCFNEVVSDIVVAVTERGGPWAEQVESSHESVASPQ
jgi:hypothetical protein